MADLLNTAGAARGDNMLTALAGYRLPATGSGEPSRIERLMANYRAANAAHFASLAAFNKAKAAFLGSAPSKPVNASSEVTAAWERQCDRLSGTTGLDAAEKDCERLLERTAVLAKDIAATPATSRSDLAMKLELVRDWTGGEGYWIRGNAGVDEQLGLSLLNDLLSK